MRFGVGLSRRTLSAAMAVCIVVPLSGCVAAAAPLVFAASTAATGFLGYKLFQTASGAEIGVELHAERIDPTAAEVIQEADALAFWASPDRTLVITAEEVERSGQFARVISPARGAATLRELGVPTEIGSMTMSERRDGFARLARATNADLVLAIHQLGIDTAMNTFSLSRARMTINSRVYLYSRAADREVWSTDLDLILGVGNNTPSDAEIEDVMGRAIAERLADIAAGRAIAGDAS